MNRTDLEVVKFDNDRLIANPQKHFQELARQDAVENLRGEVQYEAASAEYEAGQTSQVNAAAGGSLEIADLMNSFEVGIEEAQIQQSFNAARHDAKAREMFGGYSAEGSPRGHAAYKKAYGDALFQNTVAAEFAGSLDYDKLSTINDKSIQQRENLIRSYQKNLGFTREEAETAVHEQFGEFETKLSRKTAINSLLGKGVTQDGQSFMDMIMERGDAMRPAEGDAAESWINPERGMEYTIGAGKFLFGNVLKSLELLGIVDQPLAEGTMKYTNILNMSPEQFAENYPEESQMTAKMLEINMKENPTPEEKKQFKTMKEAMDARTNEMIANNLAFVRRQDVALREGAKQAAKEAKRIITGGEYDEAVINEFVANITDDEKKQVWLKRAIPFLSVAPILGAERHAARMAKEMPDYFFQNTTMGKIVEVFTSSKPGSWVAGSRATAMAVDSSAQTVANTKTAVDGGDVAATKRKIVEDIANEDYSDPLTAEAATESLKKLKKMVGDDPAGQEQVAKLESDIRQAQGTAAKDKNESVPSAHPWSVPYDAVTAPLVRETVARLNAQPLSGATDGRLGQVRPEKKGPYTAGIIEYKPNLTIGEFFEASYNGSGKTTLDRLGYGEGLLKKLITTNDEAKLFVLLHEEAHKIAGDHLEVLYGSKGPDQMRATNAQVRRIEQEQLAMINALHEFSQITGKPFTNVAHPHMSPASFAHFDPESQTVRLNALPHPDPVTLPFPDDNTLAFLDPIFASGADYRKAAKAIEMRVRGNITPEGQSDPTKPVPARRMLQGTYDNMREEIAIQDFADLGEAFGLPRGEGEQFVPYTKRLYAAFVDRFGASEGELAQGLNKYPDMTPELKKYQSEAQLAKIEEIVNTWRGMKDLLAKTEGTVLRDDMMNLALWYKSQISDGGANFRNVQSRIESLNRAAKGKNNGTTWASPAVQRGTVVGQTTVPVKGRDGKMTTKAEDRTSIGVVEDKPRGALTSITEAELSKSQGQVFPQKDREPSDPGAPIPENQQHGATGPEATAAREDDAMAHRVELQPGQNIEDLNQIERNRLAEQARVQPTPEGPVTATTHSLEGSPEQLRVLELEEFARVGATEPLAVVVDKKINVFHADAKNMTANFGAILGRANGKEMFDNLYKGFVDNQLKEMAGVISDYGADSTEMLLFHRALGVAKAMQDMAKDGKISAATEDWLNSMDLRAGASGATNEEAILNGLRAAEGRYGFAFNMQKDYQNVIDTRMAEIYAGLPSRVARNTFVAEYGALMSGPEAVLMRRELNAARQRLIDIVGGPCA